MIEVYAYDTLGKAEYDWLSTHHHFSFGDYHNPDRMGFGNLRVINDDTIQPGTGFPMHPHRDMEIITYVTKGAITHKDSEGNEGRTEAGNVQIMSAGSGIFHSEYNHATTETKLFQIWIKPRVKNLKPSWNSHQFPEYPSNELTLLVSGDRQAPLTINQDAQIFAGYLNKNQSITHHLRSNAYVVAVEGQFFLNDILLSPGDGAELTKMRELLIRPIVDGKLLLIEI